MLLRALATDRLMPAALMGLFFGLAYLTKSFAFVVALLTIVALVGAIKFTSWYPDHHRAIAKTTTR